MHRVASVALLVEAGALTVASVARAHGAGRWVWLVALSWSVLVARERIREAAHWPSDVVGGGLLGLLSWNVAILALNPTEGRS